MTVQMDTGCTITEKLITKHSAIFEAASIELKKREAYEEAVSVSKDSKCDEV